MKTLKKVLKRFEFDWSFFLMLIFIILLNIFLFIPEIQTAFNAKSEFEAVFFRYFTGFLTGVFITTILTEILLILKDIKGEEAKHEQRQK